MKVTPEQNEKISKMTFASVYPHYVNKVEHKGRTKAELNRVIEWLTGFDEASLNLLIKQQVNFEAFFEAAVINPKASLIKGVICGHRIEEIDNELTRNVRCLDKLVDDLAKGKNLNKLMGLI